MGGPEQEPQGSLDSFVTSGCPGRALIGWMSEQDATLALAARRTDQADDPALAQTAAAARDAVAERPAGVDQEGLISPLPEGLAEHVAALKNEPQSAAYFAEGWDVALVDLTRVCSLQPTVQSEQAVERAAGLDPEDPAALSALTLPLPAGAQELPIQYDEARQTWLVTAANPNLKIAGHFGGMVEGHRAFGFIVAVMPSFLQVARHQGRYVLRDGYHRAYGLLSAGISSVPAFVRDFGVGELGLGQGLFGTDVYLSDRPPLLPDFGDDAVAADVRIPIVQKMLVIQGMELTPLG